MMMETRSKVYVVLREVEEMVLEMSSLELVELCPQYQSLSGIPEG